MNNTTNTATETNAYEIKMLGKDDDGIFCEIWQLDTDLTPFKKIGISNPYFEDVDAVKQMAKAMERFDYCARCFVATA